MTFHDGKFRKVEYERFKEWHRVTHLMDRLLMSFIQKSTS